MSASAPSQFADDLLRTAAALRKSGRVHDAIEAYERLLQVDPQLPDSWYNLGYLQRRARRYDAALASYQQALDRGISGPEEVHLNRAVIFSDDLARLDAAERELNAALLLNPRYVPALLNLGNLHEDLGNRPMAEAAYERTLRIEPFNSLALARMVEVRGEFGVGDPWISRLKAAIARKGIDSADRANLGFALGHALDRAGAYRDAFAAYTTANRDSRQATQAAGIRYDRAAQEHLVDQLILSFPEASSSSPADSPDGAIRPVFVCGLFRSGSTLVEQMLAGHPNVTSGGELDLIPALVREQLSPFPASIAGLDAARRQALQAIYLDRIATRLPGASCVTDKRPDNFLFIGLIKTLFPNAKVVHTHRAPLDNCLSMFFLHLDESKPYAFDLLDIAHWVGQYRRLMAHWKKLYGDAIHDVSYDQLVAEPTPVLSRLLAYCDLPWDDACQLFYKNKTAVKTASVWQVRQPLYARSSGRWANYEPHLAKLRDALALLPPAAL